MANVEARRMVGSNGVCSDVLITALCSRMRTSYNCIKETDDD